MRFILKNCRRDALHVKHVQKISHGSLYNYSSDHHRTMILALNTKQRDRDGCYHLLLCY